VGCVASRVPARRSELSTRRPGPPLSGRALRARARPALSHFSGARPCGLVVRERLPRFAAPAACARARAVRMSAAEEKLTRVAIVNEEK
jgi:hypothetical protein